MKPKQPLKANKQIGKFVKKEINVDKQELTFPDYGGTSNRLVSESNILDHLQNMSSVCGICNVFLDYSHKRQTLLIAQCCSLISITESFSKSFFVFCSILCSMFYVLRFMFYFMLYYILCSILCSIYVPFHVRRYIFLLQNSDTQFLLFQMIAFRCSQSWSLVSPLLLASLSPNHRGN